MALYGAMPCLFGSSLKIQSSPILRVVRYHPLRSQARRNRKTTPNPGQGQSQTCERKQEGTRARGVEFARRTSIQPAEATGIVQNNYGQPQHPKPRRPPAAGPTPERSPNTRPRPAPGSPQLTAPFCSQRLDEALVVRPAPIPRNRGLSFTLARDGLGEAAKCKLRAASPKSCTAT